MKSLKALLFILFFITVKSQAQVQVDKILYRSKEHYITTSLPYHIAGTFLPPDKKEPSTVLNPDGTGVIQNEDLTKQKINWGIECNWEGTLASKEGFNSASYTFWYRTNDSDEWNYSQFSIHFAKKKMFLMGERVKMYEDFNVQ
ncbi:hypothetical protein [Flavobacterium reichenbachii]|uniref:Uncharacterized protein n=1 Tax=Flavobacterium reichenbachii TaxID=362418 RepID=A0A085ZLW9_9FLAO|nr:hypothetical protein [Flavobacterium reichenbachii]KFF05433.1 hypothetical protein IW19_07840 [Flavobacterium reichenbachii]OXB12364.1 hypothetical protein B0A68_19230 [Flavobacterium reichenbachii]